MKREILPNCYLFGENRIKFHYDLIFQNNKQQGIERMNRIPSDGVLIDRI